MSQDLAIPVTEITVRAAEAAGESAVGDLYPLIAEHWWVAALLVALRLAQPVLFHLAQKTQTRVDDKIVKTLAWLLGAVERQKAEKEEKDGADKKP
tara:strand:+ start:878 stop:1165 length:288 start_codon:yes stop_codon:yes gene_type:complete